MQYLSEEYPCLYVFILEHLGKKEEIDQYMTKCKAYEDNHLRYSLYVHGYFLVWLDRQKKEGKLKQGTCNNYLINDLYSKGKGDYAVQG